MHPLRQDFESSSGGQLYKLAATQKPREDQVVLGLGISPSHFKALPADGFGTQPRQVQEHSLLQRLFRLLPSH